MFSSSIRVRIIDDVPLLRAGLERALLRAPHIAVVDASPSSAVLDGGPVDVTIVGLCSPPLGALAIVRRVCATSPHSAVLALCVQPDAIAVAVYLRAGAVACALVTQTEAEIVEAVTRAARGERYLPPGVPADEVQRVLAANTPCGLDQLTPREHEIFGFLIRGLANQEVAAALGIGCRTVETHRRNIMNKLAAHSIADVVHAAARHGILVVPPRPLPANVRR